MQTQTKNTVQRVVVTGCAGITALGDTFHDIQQAINQGKTGICRFAAWEKFSDFHTRLGAPVTHFTLPTHYPRKQIRGMGRVAQMSLVASERALQDAGLFNDPILKSGKVGISYGSSAGSPEPVQAFGNMMQTGSLSGVNSTSYIQMMSHTSAVNVGVYLGLQGRIIPACSACTSGSQAIGFAYEAIKYGQQTIMLAGGAEELSSLSVSIFDTLFATSTKNDTPELTPRPFDQDRDGLVVGEGACTLILENYDHAIARGAKIYAEIIGFATNSDGNHLTQPASTTMQRAMELALENANLPASAIGYVNAHGTATPIGDIAESQAAANVYGKHMPMSTFKGHYGHTLGACGAVESWLSIEMMRHQWFAPTANLKNIDPACGDLDYIMDKARQIDTEFVVNNNFAFGGINTSLIFKRH